MKLLVVDDHALFREGLVHVIQKLDEHTVLLEASNADDAFLLLAENPDIDLVLLDLNMPQTDGFSVLQTAGNRYPLLPIAVLSASRKIKDMQRVMSCGAMGFIPKDTTGELMLSAVRMILSGGVYIPPAMAQGTRTPATSTDLTPRQKEVLAMMVKGLSNKAIAAELHIAEATIKMHVTSIFKTLDVSNRTQAVIAAQEQGIMLDD